VRVDANGDVRINQAQASRVLTGPQSDAARHLRLTARLTENRAKLRSPVDTGTLRNSHHTTNLTVSRGVLSTSVETPQDYALAVHEGVGPRIIRPRKRKFLKFPGADGQPVFARQVSQRARPARPWLRDALRHAAANRGFTVTP